MKNTLKISLLLILFSLSSCYDELDKTEAFEPFTRLTFSPEGGDFTDLTRTEAGDLIETAQLTIEVTAPGLQSATATALGGDAAVDLGTLNFTDGRASLVVPVSTLGEADRIQFTAQNTDGRDFSTRYQILY
jgi:hypothetical protein